MPKADNFYDDPDDQHDRLTEDGDDGSSAVGLLPKSILMGKEFEVGDKVILRITAIRDDQVAVEYPTDDGEAPAPAKEETPAEAPPVAEPPAENPMYE